MTKAALSEIAGELGRVWGVPDLPSVTTIEFSHRMTRSLGRCFPVKGIVRLNAALRDEEGGLLREVLCHELAHLVVYLQGGPDAQPHGAEWRRLVEEAGYTPSRRLGRVFPEPHGRPARQLRRFEHRCPICQSARIARTASRRWQCVDCVSDGLAGDLVVSPLPSDES